MYNYSEVLFRETDSLCPCWINIQENKYKRELAVKSIVKNLLEQEWMFSLFKYPLNLSLFGWVHWQRSCYCCVQKHPTKGTFMLIFWSNSILRFSFIEFLLVSWEGRCSLWKEIKKIEWKGYLKLSLKSFIYLSLRAESHWR